MNINLDNDMAVINATVKQEHPQGVLMSWPHPSGGNALQVVYEEFKAAQVADWANRVRAFVKQVKTDVEIRARRDRELTAAEAEAPVPVPRLAPQPRPDAPVRRAEPASLAPVQALQDQLEAATAALGSAQVRRAEAEAQVAASTAMVRALQAAICVLQEETENDAERANRKTARAVGKRARKVKTQKARVQGSAQGTPDHEAGTREAAGREQESAE